MLDVELQIVDSEVVDLSAATSQTATATVLGRRGFTADTTFVINIEEVSAATDADPVTFDLQCQVDGTNYFSIAQIKLYGDTALAKKKIFSMPIGMIDLRDEVQGINDMKVRVVVSWATTATADDFTYSAYIAGGNSYPPNNVI